MSKALRFPHDDETKKALKQAEELLEEDRKLAADIVEGELDDEDDGMDF
jgi:26S proteasome regulatory subunit N3